MKYKHLTQGERYYIFVRIANLDSLTEIANSLNISVSTVSRELKRNADSSGKYNPGIANKKYMDRKSKAHSKKQFKQFKPKIFQKIKEALSIGTSPEQIAGELKLQKKHSPSYGTIYRFIKQDKISGGNLFKLLPHKGKKYRYSKTTKIAAITDKVDITLRPKIVNEKKRIGDHEIDLIVGKKSGSQFCLLTMVDRKSRYTRIMRLQNRKSSTIQNALEFLYDNTIIPFQTITSDNGSEFANHKDIANNLGCGFFFARPYKSCDRGLNEHTNGLIRRFLPKGTDFKDISNDTISYIQHNLNNRPRKVLGFLTPHKIMLKYLKRIYPLASNFALNL